MRPRYTAGTAGNTVPQPITRAELRDAFNRTMDGVLATSGGTAMPDWMSYLLDRITVTALDAIMTNSAPPSEAIKRSVISGIVLYEMAHQYELPLFNLGEEGSKD